MATPKLSRDEEIRALEIHKRAIVVDGLQPTGSGPMGLKDFDEGFIDELMKGGFTAICLSAPNYDEMSFSQAVRRIVSWYQRFKELGRTKVQLATTVLEIKEAKEKGRIAVVLHSQGSGYLENNLNNLEAFHKLGMRIMQPTYQSRNQFGDGCGEKKDAGLSDLGVKWVEEMNRLRLVISLSHASQKTSAEIMEASKDPVIFSHSSPRSLHEHPRNISDDLIKICAEKGGVIGLVPLATFGILSLEDYLNHVDYVVDLAGADSAGVGLDYAKGWQFTLAEVIKWARSADELHPKGIYGPLKEKMIEYGEATIEYSKIHTPWLDSLTEMPMITKGLLARGYSEQEIIKILGSNFLRVFERVWGS